MIKFQKKYKESIEMFKIADTQFSNYDWEENGFIFIKIKSSLIKLNDFNDEKDPEIVNPLKIRGVKKLSLLNLNFMKFGDNLDDDEKSQIEIDLEDSVDGTNDVGDGFNKINDELMLNNNGGGIIENKKQMSGEKKKKKKNKIIVDKIIVNFFFFCEKNDTFLYLTKEYQSFYSKDLN